MPKPNSISEFHTLLLKILSIEGCELRLTYKPVSFGHEVQIEFYRFGEYAVTLQGGIDEERLLITLREFCNEIDKLQNEGGS